MAGTGQRDRGHAASLTGISVFSGLSARDRQKAAAMLNWHRFDSGSHLVSRQQPDRDVYLVQSGRVRVITYSIGGRELAFQELGPGSMFGELSCIDNQPRMADVVALTEVFAAIVPPEQFYRLLDEYPVVSKQVMLRLAAMVRNLGDRLYELSTMDVGQRLACELLRLSQAGSRGEARIDRLPTHMELASSISTGREVITRLLRQFEQDKLVHREGSRLDIPSVTRLRRHVESGGGRPGLRRSSRA